MTPYWRAPTKCLRGPHEGPGRRARRESGVTVVIHTGDCCEVLKGLPTESVHCVVTSPPYWRQRDYGVPGQLGLEKTPEEYVAKLTAIFAEVRRVLRSDGTCWINIGDKWASGGNGGGGKWMVERGHAWDHAKGAKGWRKPPAGYKDKDLVGVPFMLAFAMRAPIEHVHIKNRIDRAWLAGLIDGEGCMSIPVAHNGEKSATSFPPILTIKMCDPECLEKANSITGFMQTLRQDHASICSAPPGAGGGRREPP